MKKDKFKKLVRAIEELKKVINSPTASHYSFTRGISSDLELKAIDVTDAWDAWVNEDPGND